MKIFLFPGQGSQYVGMGKSLYDNFSAVKALYEEASDALHLDLKKLSFDGPESDLKLTHITQPAILTHSVAAFRMFTQETGIAPDFVAGHSLGEYSALVAAGSLQFTNAVKLVHRRGQFMQEAVPVGTGAMAALVGGEEAGVKSLCEEASRLTGRSCEMANFNGGGQIVISGYRQAVEEAVRIASSDPAYGVARAILLPVSAPFHSSLMKKAEENMRPLLEATPFSPLACPYIANVDAQVHREEGVKERLIQQICGSVRWEQSMKQLPALGVTEALEIGPGRVLAGLLRRIEKSIKCRAVDAKEDIK